MAPMPHRRLLGLGCPLWVCGQPRPHTFGGTQPQGPWACGDSTPAAQKWQKTAKIPVATGKRPSAGQKVLACQNGMARCNHVHGLVPTHASNSPKHVFAHSGHWGPTQVAKHASSPWGPWWPSDSEAQLSDSEANVENFKSVFGWPPAHACGCM